MPRYAFALSLLLPVIAATAAPHQRRHARKNRSAALLHKEHALQGARSGGSTVEEVIASLEDILKGIEGKQESAKIIAASRVGSCDKTTSTLEKLVEKGEKTAQEASEDLEAIDTEVAGIESEVAIAKKKITDVSHEIDDLIEQLGDLRADQRNESAEASASLRQVEAVIAEASSKAREARSAGGRRAAQLRSKVSELEALGGQLQSSAQDAEEPASFVQTAASLRGRHHKRRRGSSSGKEPDSAAVIVLKEDKANLLQADHAADKDFDDEEKRLIELIAIKREELSKLEASMRDLQPALADKLKESAETNRTLAAAKRAVVRDQDSSADTMKFCETMAKISEGEVKARFKLSGVLKMAIKVLETVDTAAFLAKDLKGLEPSDPLPRAPVAAALATSFVQIAATRSSLIDAAAAELRADASESESDAVAAGSRGPFDEVSQMIQALVAQLQEQAVDDTDRDQFCTEEVAKNRNSSHAAANALEVMKSEILWAETAVARLDEEVAFFQAEKDRLTESASAAASDLQEEEKRRGKEAADLATSEQVVMKAIEVLTELCDLPTASASLLATNRTKKLTQCEQAAEFLREAVDLITKAITQGSANLADVRTLLGDLRRKADKAMEARTTDLLTANRARARRADELAAGKVAAEEKTKDLALIETAGKELETNCGPKQETHEERMSRRADEIDALKNALSVLEGESVPS